MNPRDNIAAKLVLVAAYTGTPRFRARLHIALLSLYGVTPSDDLVVKAEMPKKLPPYELNEKYTRRPGT